MNRLIRLTIMALLLAAGVALPSGDVMAHGYPPHPYVSGTFWFGSPVYVNYPVGYDGPPLGAIDLDVSPEETKVWVDGKFAGTCDDWDGFPSWLYLKAGSHQLKLQSPGGRVFSEKVRIRAGMKLNYDLKLEK